MWNVVENQIRNCRVILRFEWNVLQCSQEVTDRVRETAHTVLFMTSVHHKRIKRHSVRIEIFKTVLGVRNRKRRYKRNRR